MVQIKKCQSKKHDFGGCGDPRCPEGMSIQAAVDDAVKNRDLNSFLAARELQGATPVALERDRGLMSLTFASNGKQAQFNYPANRPEVAEHIRSIDKNNLLSFDNAESMKAYLNRLYDPYACVDFHEYVDNHSGFDLKRLSVADMKVDADVRGMGVGRHMRATIMKFADEHNYVITGSPTEIGDGNMKHTKENAEEFKSHALAHKARLVKFYLDSGYEYNYALDTFRYVDYWTNEPFPQDGEWEKKLHPDAANFLRHSGHYIRWPNNKVPKNWAASTR